MITLPDTMTKRQKADALNGRFTSDESESETKTADALPLPRRRLTLLNKPRNANMHEASQEDVNSLPIMLNVKVLQDFWKSSYSGSRKEIDEVIKGYGNKPDIKFAVKTDSEGNTVIQYLGQKFNSGDEVPPIVREFFKLTDPESGIDLDRLSSEGDTYLRELTEKNLEAKKEELESWQPISVEYLMDYLDGAEFAEVDDTVDHRLRIIPVNEESITALVKRLQRPPKGEVPQGFKEEGRQVREVDGKLETTFIGSRTIPPSSRFPRLARLLGRNEELTIQKPLTNPRTIRKLTPDETLAHVAELQRQKEESENEKILDHVYETLDSIFSEQSLSDEQKEKLGRYLNGLELSDQQLMEVINDLVKKHNLDETLYEVIDHDLLELTIKLDSWVKKLGDLPENVCLNEILAVIDITLSTKQLEALEIRPSELNLLIEIIKSTNLKNEVLSSNGAVDNRIRKLFPKPTVNS